MNQYLKQIQNSINFMEENLSNKISIHEIAKRAGMSPWHFQRIFKSITGDHVKEYLRKRRFTMVAMKLRNNPSMRILDLALDCQFETQESFSRAFKLHFKKTPKEFATSTEGFISTTKFPIEANYLKHLHGEMTMEPKIIDIAEKKLIGIGVQFTGVFAKGGKEDQTVAKLWGRFKARINELPNLIGTHYYGLVDCFPTDSNNESDENLVYFACAEVKDFKNIPTGMRPIILPASKFAIFTHKAPPNEIDNTLKYIYSSWLPKSGFTKADGADLEILPVDYGVSKYFDYGITIK